MSNLSNRPASILWFERIYWLSVLLGIGDVVISEAENIDGTVPGWIIGTVAIVLLLSAALWYFIAIKGRNWAKWVQVIVTAIVVLSVIIEILAFLIPQIDQWDMFLENPDDGSWPQHWTVIYFGTIMLDIFTASLLFRRDAVEWISRDHVDVESVFE